MRKKIVKVQGPNGKFYDCTYVMVRPFSSGSFQHGAVMFHIRKNEDCWIPVERAEAGVRAGQVMYTPDFEEDGALSFRNVSPYEVEFTDGVFSKAELQAMLREDENHKRNGTVKKYRIFEVYGPVPGTLKGTIVRPLGVLRVPSVEMQMLSENSEFVSLIANGILVSVKG